MSGNKRPAILAPIFNLPKLRRQALVSQPPGGSRLVMPDAQTFPQSNETFTNDAFVFSSYGMTPTRTTSEFSVGTSSGSQAYNQIGSSRPIPYGQNFQSQRNQGRYPEGASNLRNVAGDSSNNSIPYAPRPGISEGTSPTPTPSTSKQPPRATTKPLSTTSSQFDASTRGRSFNSNRSSGPNECNYRGITNQMTRLQRGRPEGSELFGQAATFPDMRFTSTSFTSCETGAASPWGSHQRMSNTVKSIRNRMDRKSMKILTVTPKISEHSEYLRSIPSTTLMLQLFGILKGVVMKDLKKVRKVFTLIHKGQEVNCVFYEIDREMPRLMSKQWQRCVGSFNNEGLFHCVSVRPATQEEVQELPFLITLSESSLLKLFSLNEQ